MHSARLAARRLTLGPRRHHDAPFDADPPSYNALFCVTPGGSSTAYADAGAAYRNLPPTLQRQADSAVCVYRRSLSFGAERLGLPALPKRLVQQSMSSVRAPTPFSCIRTQSRRLHFCSRLQSEPAQCNHLILLSNTHKAPTCR